MVVRQLAQFDSALILVYIEQIPVAACTTDINLLQDRVLKFARNTIARETFSAVDYDMPDIVVETMATRSKLAKFEGRLPSMYD